jgi:hypothetical protein
MQGTHLQLLAPLAVATSALGLLIFCAVFAEAIPYSTANSPWIFAVVFCSALFQRKKVVSLRNWLCPINVSHVCGVRLSTQLCREVSMQPK